MPTVGVLYIGLFNALEYSPLLIYLPPLFSTIFNAYPYILYFYILWYITDALSFSFPFSLSPSSIEYSTVRNMFYNCLYMIMLVFVYMFIFVSIFHV
jgi:hypothetical protein